MQLEKKSKSTYSYTFSSFYTLRKMGAYSGNVHFFFNLLEFFTLRQGRSQSVLRGGGQMRFLGNS